MCKYNTWKYLDIFGSKIPLQLKKKVILAGNFISSYTIRSSTGVFLRQEQHSCRKIYHARKSTNLSKIHLVAPRSSVRTVLICVNHFGFSINFNLGHFIMFWNISFRKRHQGSSALPLRCIWWRQWESPKARTEEENKTRNDDGEVDDTENAILCFWRDNLRSRERHQEEVRLYYKT